MSLIIHKCFDEGLITINQDYRLEVSKHINDKELLKYLENYKGKKIKLPVKKEYYPDKNLLLKHSEQVFKN